MDWANVACVTSIIPLQASIVFPICGKCLRGCFGAAVLSHDHAAVVC